MILSYLCGVNVLDVHSVEMVSRYSGKSLRETLVDVEDSMLYILRYSDSDHESGANDLRPGLGLTLSLSSYS